MIMNPTLIASAPKTYTPTDEALDAAIDATEQVTARDYPKMYKLLIVVNTICWVAYLMGWLR